LSSAERSPVLLKYLTLLVGLLVVLAFGVRPALRHAAMSENKAIQADGVPHALPEHASAPEPPALSPPEPPVLDPDRRRAQEILEQVTGQLKNEPAQSSRLLQSWIHSE
jgi:flagellar M-ring protein FliF